MLERGFIGPIGDDLPSLIPLLFGLVIFFSTFSLTFDAFDARNTEFKDELTVMRISTIMQSNSYIFSHDNFNDLCDGLGLINLNYVAAISNDGTTGKQVNNIFEVSFFRNRENRTFYCSNVDEVSSPEQISDFLSLQEAEDRKIVTRIFPIVLEDEQVVRPMHLFVVAWK